jgi:membrane protein CcdC involved in cytochrome C biogenesis
MALVMIAMAGLLIRALIIGEFAGILFLLGFGALFVWQIGSFMRRNRPRSYTLTSLPNELLP